MIQKDALLYDIDGVLADSQKPVLAEFNRRFDTLLTVDDWISYTFLMAEAHRLSGESPIAAAQWLFSIEVMAKADPYPTAVEKTEHYAQLGYQQHIVSSRPFDQRDTTIDWLMKHFSWVQPDRVFFRDKDSELSGDEFKNRSFQRLQPLGYLEDSGETVKYIAGIAAKDFLRLPNLKLLDQPWNRSFADLNDHRTNWEEFEPFLAAPDLQSILLDIPVEYHQTIRDALSGVRPEYYMTTLIVRSLYNPYSGKFYFE